MKKIIAFSFVAAMGWLSAEACTSLIAAKGATKDGSVMITYAADSHTLYGDMPSAPAADHRPGEMRKIFDWDSGRYLGEIPQPAHTYSRIGHVNENGVAMAESTWGGREELTGSGIIDYGSLIYITLQRARTAEEALNVMTELVEKYGYASSGESFTIADPDNVWIMEMTGKGKDDKGAVWVARRVPDDCIAAHANQSRIHQFPLKDKSGETRYSKDVISFAREKGYFNGKDEDFSFSNAYDPVDPSTTRSCDGRVWSFYNKFVPGMDEYLPWVLEAKGEPMPLWMKPEKPVSLSDIQWMMRDHFENTPMDMTQDIGAGPYKVPYRWRPMTFEVDGKEYLHERAIATQQTGFSFVSQMNNAHPDAMKGILWFGTDDANTCVYMPIYCSITEVPRQLAVGNGDLYNLSWDANFWVNNWVANQAYHKYDKMIQDIRPVQKALETAMQAEADSLKGVVAALSPSEASKLLTDRSAYWAQKATSDYKQLGEYLLIKYIDGNIKREKDGEFQRTETGMPVSPVYGGYDEKYFRSIVNDPDGGERLRVKDKE
ncbi:MAG: dipeptidase [Bacteroidales bacterium]|nr:dipeptidase [Bacteroidales bacterium]